MGANRVLGNDRKAAFLAAASRQPDDNLISAALFDQMRAFMGSLPRLSYPAVSPVE
jgi:hypothetical protein